MSLIASVNLEKKITFGWFRGVVACWMGAVWAHGTDSERCWFLPALRELAHLSGGGAAVYVECILTMHIVSVKLGVPTGCTDGRATVSTAYLIK